MGCGDECAEVRWGKECQCAGDRQSKECTGRGLGHGVCGVRGADRGSFAIGNASGIRLHKEPKRSAGLMLGWD